MSLLQSNEFFLRPIIPKQEVFCYEAIWANLRGVRFQDLSAYLQKKMPSDACPNLKPETQDLIEEFLNKIGISQYNILLRETVDYPASLLELELPLIYYRGDLSLINSPCVSIVGSRKASERGLDAARLIAVGLSECGYTIVSGLARGIDTAAHTSTIKHGGNTIGVIGTPLNQYYPPENRELQEKIASEHLLLSHVPFFKYSRQNYKINRGFFPERNKVMAALSVATIIAEASDTSGSLIQAREAHRLGKKVIILKPSYDNPKLTWPKTYVQRGALVAESLKDIKQILEEQCAIGYNGMGQDASGRI